MWRIEEEPAVKRKNDEFLHVLYACDRGTPASQMPKATHVTTGNRTGVRIEYLGRTYEVGFDSSGGTTCAGHLKISQRERILVDETLADKLKPTFLR